MNIPGYEVENQYVKIIENRPVLLDYGEQGKQWHETNQRMNSKLILNGFQTKLKEFGFY